jgi:hypothetical protein
MAMGKRNITIYWATKSSSLIHRIRQRYNIVEGMTVNGENTVSVDGSQLKELKEVEKLGYIKLRFKQE